MKVIHLSLSSGGGAGIAARRTVEALRASGTDAQLWTGDGKLADRCLRSRMWARWRARFASVPTRLYRNRRLFSVWSNTWLPSRIAPRVAASKPDLVHLHWVGDGFLNLSELPRFGAPVVWTLHDAWAFTGGCHYPADCTRFRAGCGRCPQLGSDRVRDLSARNLKTKRMQTTTVARWITPSRWLAELSMRGNIVEANRIRVIPYGLNGHVFAPAAGDSFRRSLNVPAGSIVLVAGAADLREARKGGAMLPEAVASVQRTLGRKCVLVVFGRNSELHKVVGDVDVRCVGTLNNEAAVAGVLAGADALLMPSLQDNLPNIAIESLACGCPVIGFNSGGFCEIIAPGLTGAIAGEMNAGALAKATVDWLLQSPSRDEVSVRCRVRFESLFTYEHHARQIVTVYEEVVQSSS
jgi:glycosyltransferase involved in cell wall biosynthesis